MWEPTDNFLESQRETLFCGPVCLLFSNSMQKLGYHIVVLLLLRIRQISTVENKAEKLSEKAIRSYSILFPCLAGSLENSLEILLYMRVVELITQRRSCTELDVLFSKEDWNAVGEAQFDDYYRA